MDVPVYPFFAVAHTIGKSERNPMRTKTAADIVRHFLDCGFKRQKGSAISTWLIDSERLFNALFNKNVVPEGVKRSHLAKIIQLPLGLSSDTVRYLAGNQCVVKNFDKSERLVVARMIRLAQNDLKNPSPAALRTGDDSTIRRDERVRGTVAHWTSTFSLRFRLRDDCLTSRTVTNWQHSSKRSPITPLASGKTW